MKSVEDGAEFTKQCWMRQLNCAESVFRGVCFAQGIELSDIATKMATPFGGGVGRAEDLCGALAGGVLAIGAEIGRTGPEQDRLKSYNAAGELHRAFLESFGSTSCKVLNQSDFTSPEHRARCGKFVEEGARFAIDILRKK